MRGFKIKMLEFQGMERCDIRTQEVENFSETSEARVRPKNEFEDGYEVSNVYGERNRLSNATLHELLTRISSYSRDAYRAGRTLSRPSMGLLVQ